MKLTGNKDVDRKILNNLEDKDLVKFCAVDKKANSLCNDQVFWMNRVFDRFGYVGGDILRKNKEDRTWSEYYIQDLRKINSANAEEYLINGSKYGILDHVIISLKNGGDIHAWDDQPLMLASLHSQIEVIKYLLNNGADIHARSDYALLLASENGDLDVVKYLVEQGADIHAIDDYALRESSWNGHLDVVKYLVEQGADIHARYDWAMRNAPSFVVKYLESL